MSCKVTIFTKQTEESVVVARDRHSCVSPDPTLETKRLVQYLAVSVCKQGGAINIPATQGPGFKPSLDVTIFHGPLSLQTTLTLVSIPHSFCISSNQCKTLTRESQWNAGLTVLSMTIQYKHGRRRWKDLHGLV